MTLLYPQLLCIHSDRTASLIFSLALRPSVFPFFGPLTSRVTRCAACPKYIAIALFSLCCGRTASRLPPPNSFLLCATLSIAIATVIAFQLSFVAKRCIDFSACLPPASRGATACPITLNLAVALLSIDDWTQRDCPYAVQPSCAQLLPSI